MSNPRHRLLFVTSLLATLGIAACSNQRQAESAAADMAASSVTEEHALAAPESAPVAGNARDSAAGGGSAAAEGIVQTRGVDPSQMGSDVGASTDPRRRFVRTADARFQVDDVYRSALAIEDAAVAAGGFVTSNRIHADIARVRERPLGNGERVQLSEFTTRGELVVRVPSDRTQSFLRGIVRQMAFLDERNFEASDVQFELLRQQLAAQRAQAVQSNIADAATQSGKVGAKVDAAMARAQALAARDEAEVARRELEDRVGFSTLRLALYQPAQVRKTVVPDTEAILRRSGPGFFSAAGQALKSGWFALLDVLVALFHVWPLWLAIGAGLWAVGRLRRWRTGRHAP